MRQTSASRCGAVFGLVARLPVFSQLAPKTGSPATQLRERERSRSRSNALSRFGELAAHGARMRWMADEVIGREQELEELGRFLAAVDELPSALVLEGSPGIGKTVLWRAGLDLARAQGFRVIAAIPASAETRLSLSAVVDLLTPVLDDVLPSLPAPQRRALEIALLLAEPEGSLPDARAFDAALLSVLRLLAS